MEMWGLSGMEEVTFSSDGSVFVGAGAEPTRGIGTLNGLSEHAAVRR